MKLFSGTVEGECPVCLETKELKHFRNQNIISKTLSPSVCKHRICANCKKQIKKSDNPPCPLCRYKKPISNFSNYEKRMRNNFGRNLAPNFV